MNNVIELLEECVTNGDRGIEQLYAWFCDERNAIMQAVLDARFEENE